MHAQAIDEYYDEGEVEPAQHIMKPLADPQPPMLDASEGHEYCDTCEISGPNRSYCGFCKSSLCDPCWKRQGATRTIHRSTMFLTKRHHGHLRERCKLSSPQILTKLNGKNCIAKMSSPRGLVSTTPAAGVLFCETMEDSRVYWLPHNNWPRKPSLIEIQAHDTLALFLLLARLEAERVL